MCGDVCRNALPPAFALVPNVGVSVDPFAAVLEFIRVLGVNQRHIVEPLYAHLIDGK